MRPVIVLLSLGSLLAACAREPEAATEATSEPGQSANPAAAEQAPPPRVSAAAAPRMGGAVVVTGDHAVEVVARADGEIDAAVATAAGEAVANSEVAGLEVTLQGEGQARHTVALAWDGPRAMFHGKAKADARLVSGPLEVSCSLRGKLHKGRLDMAVVLPRPSFGG